MGGLTRQPIIRATTRLLGVIGWPVAHSLSPAMHNAALAVAGLDSVYVALPVTAADLPHVWPALPALGFQGVNLTLPHKEAALSLLDEIDPAAQTIGAVNTVHFRGAAVGYNTDWSGFLADLQSLEVAVAGRVCLVLGGGGSARAVGYALTKERADVHFLVRRLSQGEAIVNSLRVAFPGSACAAHTIPSPQETPRVSETLGVLQAAPTPTSQLTELAQTAALIVNTTPVGMASGNHEPFAPTPWPAGLPLPAGAWVYDLVYRPAETPFLRQARLAGCRGANGLGMLLHQAAEAFAIWTGQRPDLAVMRQALTAAYQEIA